MQLRPPRGGTSKVPLGSAEALDSLWLLGSGRGRGRDWGRDTEGKPRRPERSGAGRCAAATPEAGAARRFGVPCLALCPAQLSETSARTARR